MLSIAAETQSRNVGPVDGPTIVRSSPNPSLLLLPTSSNWRALCVCILPGGCMYIAQQAHLDAIEDLEPHCLTVMSIALWTR